MSSPLGFLHRFAGRLQGLDGRFITASELDGNSNRP